MMMGCLAATSAWAQLVGGGFRLDPTTLDPGGGRTCSGSPCVAPLFQVDGTLAQIDAGRHASSGVTPAFELFGGFWYAANPILVPVSLAKVHARRIAPGVVDLEWQTASEVGAIAFEWLPATATPALPARIPAQGDTLLPRTYRATVPIAGDDFMLAVLNADGSRDLHGPFAVDQVRGADSANDARLIDWASAATSIEQRLQARRAQALRQVQTPALGLAVDVTGLHRLDHADLVTAAFTALDGVPISELALLRRGQALPRRVVSNDALFGPGDRVEFLAETETSLYTSREVLVLTRDATRALDVGAVPASPGAAPERRSAPRISERNLALAYSFSAPGDDPWYERRLVATNAAVESTVSLDLVSSDQTPARVSVLLWGGLDFPGPAPDHHVEVWWNGQRQLDHRFDGVVEQRLSFEVPTLNSGTQTLKLRLPADTGHPADVVLLDRVEVSHRTPLQADGAFDYWPDAALCTPRSEFADGFESRGPWLPGNGDCPVQVIAGVTSQANVWRQNGTRIDVLSGLQQQAGELRFALPLSEGDRLFVAAADQWRRPQLLPLPERQDLEGEPADYLILAHPSLIDGLAPLIQAKQAQGLRVRNVDVEAVYHRYGQGRPEPKALAEFIRAMHRRWGTRFVLLVGADHYDYHNALGGQARSLVPTPYRALHPLVRYAPADQALADVDQDGVPDLALGRLPARTPQDLAQILAKMAAYARPAMPRHLWVGDRSAQGRDFGDIAQDLATTLGSGYLHQGIDRDQMPLDAARAALVQALNEGVALTQYIGHSSPNRWAFDSLLSASQIQSVLNNASQPTVVLQWGCWTGYHVDPLADGLSQAWLIGPRGAALALGAATLTEIENDHALARALMVELGRPGTTYGEALLHARQTLGADPRRADVVLGVNLFGDPAMPVRP